MELFFLSLILILIPVSDMNINLMVPLLNMLISYLLQRASLVRIADVLIVMILKASEKFFLPILLTGI